MLLYQAVTASRAAGLLNGAFNYLHCTLLCFSPGPEDLDVTMGFNNYNCTWIKHIRKCTEVLAYIRYRHGPLMNCKAIIVLILTHFFQGKSVSAQDSLVASRIYVGIASGTWWGDGNNRVLGHPVLFCFMGDLQRHKNSYGFSFVMAFGKTSKPIKIKFGDSLLIRDEYFGVQGTLDYYRQLFKWKAFSFDAAVGLGYGKISYYNPDKDTDIDKESFVFSPGVSLRYTGRRKTYLQLKAQYSIADYNLNDNVSTDLRGNYLIAKLIVGNFR